MQGVHEKQDPGAMAVAAGAKENKKAGAFSGEDYRASPEPASGMKTVVHDRAILIRHFIHECMGLTLDHAELARASAEIGDDAALEYALRKFVAVARQVARSFNELRQLTSEATR